MRDQHTLFRLAGDVDLRPEGDREEPSLCTVSQGMDLPKDAYSNVGLPTASLDVTLGGVDHERRA